MWPYWDRRLLGTLDVKLEGNISSGPVPERVPVGHNTLVSVRGWMR